MTQQTTTTSWLRAMKVGKSYVRYYDSHEALHSVQTSIWKFNHGLGNDSEKQLSTHSKIWKLHDEERTVYMLFVRCKSGKEVADGKGKVQSW